MRTFACIYKTGGDYTKKHVHILQDMVHEFLPSVERFVCLTDVDEIKGVETIPLIHNLPGKYSMQEVFRITGQVVVTGLDTVFVDDCNGLFDIAEQCKENEFYMIKAFNPDRDYANGIMVWNGDWSRLLYGYDIRKVVGYKLEQRYTIHKLRKEKADIMTLNTVFSGIYSFKYHCRNKLPSDAKVVLFHGKPRPNEVSAKWNKYWLS